MEVFKIHNLHGIPLLSALTSLRPGFFFFLHDFFFLLLPFSNASSSLASAAS